MELINPVSAISGAKPIEKESTHFFFKLPEYEAMLKEWLASGTLQPQVANKLREWTEPDCRSGISAATHPTSDFEIPGEPGKYFYVWLDAPIGYIASFQHYCDRTGHDFDSYWQSGTDTELYHFIGKDIINFHGLFWPAMLHSAGLRAPTAVYAHGFLTVNGTKMSKSRGTFIKASTYLEHLDARIPALLFCRQAESASVDDIDLNLEDFVQRVNSDVVGKVVNIASRCAGFLRKGFDKQTHPHLRRADLWWKILSPVARPSPIYTNNGNSTRQYVKSWRWQTAPISISMKKNPGSLAKQEDAAQEVHEVCSVGVNLFRVLMTYLKPVLPVMAEKAEAFLNCSLDWTALERAFAGA